MLLFSNIFMTAAWYGHLRFKHVPLILVILISWSIALIEYSIAVPANRIGSEVYQPAQLKTIQEVVTLAVFVVFAHYWLGAPITWQHLVGFAFIAIGAAFVFSG
ncbi:hypothetical protein GCM10007148_13970 [Parvularcula lutaonensis]|nr:DMT family protein [Parvularcula lutaonensis]GGY46084.1 hypothetical protein GCM10007148_13970 [Parvularcula lutaonensis]